MKTSETTSQQDLIIWCERNSFYTSLNKFDENKSYVGMIFAVPNGGRKNSMEGSKFKKEGALAGVSDLIIIVKNKIIFLEMKNLIGKQSQSQINFEALITSLGFEYYKAHKCHEAVKVIKEVLK